MRSGRELFASKVGRRMLLLFVLCALVPIVGLAAFSLGQVSGQLRSQAEQRLDDAVREVGQGIAQRLQLLDTELRFAAIEQELGPADLDALEAIRSPLGENTPRLLGVASVSSDGSLAVLSGDLDGMPSLTAEHRRRLDGGAAVLLAERRPGRPPLLLIVRPVSSPGAEPSLIVGSINPTYLWTGAADTLGSRELCVFDAGAVPLWCTRPPGGDVPAPVRAVLADAALGRLEWDLDGDALLGSFWSLPLDHAFAIQWKLLLSEARADVLSPVAGFRYFFSLIVLASLWVVLLLSIGQIRRSLVPLQRLREGTQRIAEREFDTRVEVWSGDEFQELAESFNDMAERLGRQFDALETIAEIDRSILSTIDIEKIVHTVLRHAATLIDCHAVAITLASPDHNRVPRTYTLRDLPNAHPWVETTYFEDDDLARFEHEPAYSSITPTESTPPFLAPLARSGCRQFLLFPMFINDLPSGVISLGFDKEDLPDGDTLMYVRRLADQVAVALANAHLLNDLDALNWGALTALARAVDAKSSWTAGHSERVTQLALKIAEKMDLPRDEIDIIHRGGLLHDLGKIGVPATIIDKPAPLTEQEFATMRKHPEIGANILRPISAYADVIPIVLQHHERWDGSGYPDGLAGRRIHLHARIVAVADVYDAIISDRPYRTGWRPSEVVRAIVAGDGTEFDPDVVAAFLEVMTDEGFGLVDVGAANSKSGSHAD